MLKQVAESKKSRVQKSTQRKQTHLGICQCYIVPNWIALLCNHVIHIEMDNKSEFSIYNQTARPLHSNIAFMHWIFCFRFNSSLAESFFLLLHCFRLPSIFHTMPEMQQVSGTEESRKIIEKIHNFHETLSTKLATEIIQIRRIFLFKCFKKAQKA